MIRIPAVLAALLAAQVDAAAATAREKVLRQAVDDEARARYAAEGAAPAWTCPGAGTIRFDPPGALTAHVADPGAYASWVAEHHPTEAVASITLPAAALPQALEALGFAGVPVDAAAVAVRPAFQAAHLAAVAIDTFGDDPTGAPAAPEVVDTALGEVVPGLAATASPGVLVITPTRRLKAAAIDAARTAATDQAATLVGHQDGHDGPTIDPAALATRITQLTALGAAEQKTLAGDLGVAKSGTKAELAQRIAHAQAVAGNDPTLLLDQDDTDLPSDAMHPHPALPATQQNTEAA